MNKKNIYLIFTAFYVYFIMAIFESSKGNFMPFFMDEFHINNTTLSLVLSSSTIGCVLGSFFGGHLCQKLGHKFVFITGSVISTIAILMSPFTFNIYYLGLIYFIFGIGRSSLSIAVDSMVPVLSIGYEVILMNITHFMYGLGSFAGQSAYGKLLFEGVTWRNICVFLGIFYILSIVFTSFMKMPNMHVVDNHESVKKELYKNPLIYMFVGAVTLQMISESLLNTWLITYIRSTYGFNPAAAGKYASIFFLMFALGRFLGGFIINKLGDIRGLKIFIFLGSVCVFLGLLMKESGLIIIASSGFFLSVGFPTMMVLANKAFSRNASMAIGLITTIGNILFVIIFNFVGYLNDILGSYKAFYAAPVFMICCLITLIIITKRLNENENINIK